MRDKGHHAPYAQTFNGLGHEQERHRHEDRAEDPRPHGLEDHLQYYLNSDSLDVQNAFDVLGKAIGSKRGKEGSVELLKECGSLPPVSEAPATLEGAEEGSPELPEKSGDEGQTA